MRTEKVLAMVFSSLLMSAAWAQQDHTKSAVEQTGQAVESEKQGDTSGAVEHTKAAEEQADQASKDKGSSGKVVSTGKSRKQHMHKGKSRRHGKKSTTTTSPESGTGTQTSPESGTGTQTSPEGSAPAPE